MAVTLTLLDAVETTGAGSGYEMIPLAGSNDAGIAQALIADTATVHLEVSVDGTNWVSAGADTEFTADGIASISPVPRYVRGNCTVSTTGAASLFFQLPSGWRAQVVT